MLFHSKSWDRTEVPHRLESSSYAHNKVQCRQRQCKLPLSQQEGRADTTAHLFYGFLVCFVGNLCME